MMILVDIGNSRVKWCTQQNDVITPSLAIDYKRDDFKKLLKQQWMLLNPPVLLAIATVAKKQLVQQTIDIAKQLWPDVKIVLAKSSANAHSVTNAYQNPDKLGVDRWLGLIAMQHYFSGNKCLVDCGTAVTIDFLNNQGLHLGGLICPGLLLMQRSLAIGTEKLSLNTQTFSVGLGNTTESAIYNGSLVAIAGLIEKAMKNQNKCELLVMSGGDAELLATHLNIESIIETDLVLKGLALFCSGEKL